MRPEPVVVCSVLEARVDCALERIETAPEGAALVELRADHLSAEDVAGIVVRSSRSLVVTVRRLEDGGAYEGDEGGRRKILEAALEAGAERIDVEWNSELREMVRGSVAERTILSHHGGSCSVERMRPLAEAMLRTDAAEVKLVPAAESIRDVLAVRSLLETHGHDGRLACFALGRLGALSRLLAPSWGSWGSYGSAIGGPATAEGQFSAEQLLNLYDVLRIGRPTRLFCIVGSRLANSPSPAMHQAAYSVEGLDARYLPLETDDFTAVPELAERLGIEGLAVTMPFKEAAADRCASLDRFAERAAAVNTIRLESGGWRGFNTDGPAVREAIADHVELRGAGVSILGAGGTARSVAVALAEGGAEVTLFARDPGRGGRVALELGASSATFEERPGDGCRVLVNATPLGAAGERALPPGRLPEAPAVVVDAVYGREATSLIAEARAAGLVTVDGFEMLLGQALSQFRYLTGREASAEAMRDAGVSALERMGLPAP